MAAASTAETVTARYPVGTPLHDHDQFNDLPQGTVIGPNTNEQYTKLGPPGDDRWTDAGGRHGSQRTNGFSMRGYNRILSYPDGVTSPEPAPVDAPAVGDYLDRQEQARLWPVGTKIARSGTSTEWFVKVGADQWMQYNGGLLGYEALACGRYYQVVALPPEGWLAPDETIIDVMTKFRAIAWNAQAANGVNRDPITRALTRLGCDISQIPAGVGTWVHTTEVGGLPDHTLLMVGVEDLHYGMGLFHVMHGRANHVMGTISRIVLPARIVRLGPDDYTPVNAPEGLVNDANSIAVFKSKAWKIGMRVKSSTGWCGTVENTLRAAGVSSASVIASDGLPGGWLTVEQARELPAGTLMAWESDDDPEHNFQVFVRDNDRTNPSRTRRLFGYRADGVGLRHSMGRLRALAPPDEWETFEVPHAWWDYIPPGTVFVYNRSTRYAMGLNQRAYDYRAEDAVPPGDLRDGVHRLRDFGTAPVFTFVVFP